MAVSGNADPNVVHRSLRPGWVMVRASGTETLLRVYSETSKPATTKKVLSAVTDIVRSL